MKQTSISNIQGISIISRKISIDNRGSFVKIEPSTQLEFPLTSVAFSINPQVGTLRGLHFQTEPYAEEKIVSCALLQRCVGDPGLDR
jgi:dTDP-4-dehydrorhamnose 3,5-epimerase-like enzyme